MKLHNKHICPNIRIYLSVITGNCVDQSSCLFQGARTYHVELDNKLEEADLRIIQHANDAVSQSQGTSGVVILSADTDVVVLCLYHWF